jgi:hypothetical protein
MMLDEETTTESRRNQYRGHRNERSGDLTPAKIGWITGVELLTPAKRRKTMGVELTIPQREERCQPGRRAARTYPDES